MKKTTDILLWLMLACLFTGLPTYPIVTIFAVAAMPFTAMLLRITGQMHPFSVIRRKRVPAMLLAVMTAVALTACSGAQDAASATGQAQATTPEEKADGLTVHFLDVGQGLSILCESDGRYMLYDGGDRETSSFVVSYLKNQGVQTLDYVIASHYDADHLSGLIGALNAFEVGEVIGPDYTHGSKLYQSFLTKASEIGKSVAHPAVGDEYTLGASRFKILGPGRIVGDSNDNSIVIKLIHGNTSFVFTGDAEHGEESDIVSSGADLSCDVLSVGHHGSASSTSWDFLQETLPEYAVISCGKNNSYGHPDADTIEKLQSIGAHLYRTDEQGTVIVKSNGNALTFNTSPTENYASGTDGEGIVIQETENSGDSTGSAKQEPGSAAIYILNKSSKKFHYPDCGSVSKIKPENYEEYAGARDELIAENYSPCKNCSP